MKADNDRQSKRTKLLLGNALVELMLEKGYDAISVKDIIDRANVGRSTFYAHYPGKEELFVSQLDRVLGALTEHTTAELSAANPYLPSFGLFRHVQEQYKLFKILTWSSATDLMVKHFQKSLSEKIEQQLAASGQMFEVPLPVMASFIAGSFLAVLRWWLDNKMAHSPEEIDNMFLRLAMPGIKQSVRND